MNTLVNLHELGQKLQSEFESSFTPDDFELPDSFKNSIKELGGYKYDYKQCLVHIHSDNLNGYIPNQWFVIASFFVDYYLELQKYKNLLIEVLTRCGYNTADSRKSIMAMYSAEISKKPKTEDYNQFKLKIVEKIRFLVTPKFEFVSGLDHLDKEFLISFISDYDWWYGGKSIDRGDFYISPLLALAKVINSSHSYIAEICKALADNKFTAYNLKNYYKKKRNFPVPHKTSINQPLQKIYYGAPGTGKSHTINKIINENHESVIRTTFHPDSDYSTFVGAYKPTTKDIVLRDLSGHKIEESGKTLTESKIVYEFVNQAFLNAYIQAWKFYAIAQDETNIKNQFLVIEEINRGNCAQIFGDLFQLLDRNDEGFSEYPIQADTDMKKQLKKAFENVNIALSDSINDLYPNQNDIVNQVLQGDILLLPNNLYIWATMNTSDQSLFPIDSAFKRRWDWEYMPIYNANKGYQIKVGEYYYDWWQFLKEINDLIDNMTNSEDKKLGYFFCKAKNEIITVDKFVGKVIFYLWNDVFKDFEFANQVFNDENGEILSFDRFYSTDAEGNSIVVDDIVQTFLSNLKLEPIIDEKSEESEKLSFKYSFNGKPVHSLSEVALNVVKYYAQNNPQKSAKEIRDVFIQECKGIGIAHVVETEEEFKLREGQSTAKKTVNQLILDNGETLYISNQWRVNKPDSNFNKFIAVVQNNNWGTISLTNE